MKLPLSQHVRYTDKERYAYVLDADGKTVFFKTFKEDPHADRNSGLIVRGVNDWMKLRLAVQRALQIELLNREAMKKRAGIKRTKRWKESLENIECYGNALGDT